MYHLQYANMSRISSDQMGSQRTKFAGAEGSEVNSQPDDLPPPMSGFCGQTPPADLVGPDVFAKASSRSRRPTRGRSPRRVPSPSIWTALPFVSCARFEGVRRAGSEHRKVSKPAYPLWVQRGLARGLPLRSPTTPALTLGVGGPRSAPSARIGPAARGLLGGSAAAHRAPQPESLDPAERDRRSGQDALRGPTVRRQAIGADGDEVSEAAPALRRAASGAEAQGSKGGGASPCQTAMFNVASAGNSFPPSPRRPGARSRINSARRPN